jgi:hypothetical protein
VIRKQKILSPILKNVLNQLYNHYAMNVRESGARLSNEGRSCTSSTSLGVGSGTSNKVEKYALKDFHSFRARRNLMQHRTEIEQYFAEDVETPNETFDILMWSKVNSTKFMVLSKKARDVLAIPLTTVAFESAFSTGGHVIDPCQSSLAPKTMEALICSQNWLRSFWISEHDESYLPLPSVEDEESYKLNSGNIC